MQLFGKIESIQEVETFENTDFTKQSIILKSEETGVPYKLEFHNKNILKLKEVLVGQSARISFVIRGNYYDKKDKKGSVIRKDVINI